jgi:ankyrin repeat protein
MNAWFELRSAAPTTAHADGAATADADADIADADIADADDDDAAARAILTHPLTHPPSNPPVDNHLRVDVDEQRLRGGATALHYAVLHSHCGAVAWLLERGVRPMQRRTLHHTELHTATCRAAHRPPQSRVYEHARPGRTRLTTRPPHQPPHTAPRASLHHHPPAVDGPPRGAAQANPNSVNENGATPLHFVGTLALHSPERRTITAALLTARADTTLRGASALWAGERTAAELLEPTYEHMGNVLSGSQPVTEPRHP